MMVCGKSSYRERAVAKGQQPPVDAGSRGNESYYVPQQVTQHKGDTHLAVEDIALLEAEIGQTPTNCIVAPPVFCIKCQMSNSLNSKYDHFFVSLTLFPCPPRSW